MKNTPEMTGTKTGSLAKWSAQDAKLLSIPAMYLGVCSKNSPADDITVEMKYVDPSIPPPRPKKLGEAYPLRMEKGDEVLMKKLCKETHLSKATILRLSCHAGLLAVDWTKFKRPAGAQAKPVVIPATGNVTALRAGRGVSAGTIALNVVPNADLHPAVSLRILRHGVPEQVFSDGELGQVMDAIGTLSCFWALV